jgi:hypothetical protein
MSAFFVESSDMGKLYLNYPMVEAFYHMKDIPDMDYNSYNASLDELRQRMYKQRVNRENRNHDYTKFAVTRAECNSVIKQNLEKAWLLTDTTHSINDAEPPDSGDILKAQLKNMEERQFISVLCTCVFYIVDYNPNLLQ